MSRKLSNEKWNEFISLFSSYEGTVSSFCKENNISKSQFYYHKRRAEVTTNENIPSENTISVYPNPTHDLLIIQGVEPQVLRVYDLQGRLVRTERGTQVHVAELNNGIYLLQIGTQVVRFIKKD